MKLVRRDPFAEWLPFRSFLRDFPEHFRWPAETLVLDEDELHVDEYTEDGTLVVKAEMPGIDPDEDVVHRTLSPQTGAGVRVDLPGVLQ